MALRSSVLGVHNSTSSNAVRCAPAAAPSRQTVRCCRSSPRDSNKCSSGTSILKSSTAIDARVVRSESLLHTPKHWRTYQELVQPHITAEGQASMYDALLSGAAAATPDELALLSAVRTQVSTWRLRKRFDTPEGAQVYRKATAFEALVGHLHLHDPARLTDLTEALLAASTAQQDAAGRAQKATITDDAGRK